ncbi:TetR/AcrR family transcriptional regulator [Nocardia cyriacigeorgica]|uniref:TetR/AcrR family transcriptional regulator n=2 Tax=Nocardia cyriacigeorgica TaxID=135487 RepID=A0A6P1DE66_9NOCA|nr:TetR/AcrR family transcriptional regulator [Nocardia cyriacigeorgica]
MRQVLRARVIDTARNLVCTEGWGAVNMSRVAKEVGVSRPVLYKEIGTKQDLADVVIANELDTFLTGIADTIATQADDVIDGLTAAVEYTLRTGADNALLKAVLAGRSSADTSLLPVLMTEPEPVLGRAIPALTAVVRNQYGLDDLAEADLDTMVEAVVRLALSHLFQPTGPIDRAVTQIGLVITSIFAPAVTA